MTQQQAARFSVGEALAPITKDLPQERINRYADAGGDHNPLHLDPTFAAATQFDGIIAHGMLLLAFVSEMLTASFGEAWAATGRLKIRFRGAARPGDVVTTRGRVTKVDGARIACDIECVNQSNELLVSGEAEVGVR